MYRFQIVKIVHLNFSTSKAAILYENLKNEGLTSTTIILTAYFFMKK